MPYFTFSEWSFGGGHWEGSSQPSTPQALTKDQIRDITINVFVVKEIQMHFSYGN